MPKPDSAPFSYDGLDRVIHEKARLGLLTSLMAHPKGLAFADLKQLCGLTDGNLSRHLPPGAFTLTFCQRCGAVLQLMHHGIVLLHQPSYLITAVPFNFFVQLAQVNALHLLTYQGERRGDSVRNKKCNSTGNKEDEYVQIDNGDKEIGNLLC